jgi:hypothetical protein
MASKPAFDADALITQFETASAAGSAKLRQAVTDATLQALQGRELSLKNIRAVLGTVSQAANTGLAKNPAAADAMIDQAVAGMDDALLKAVDAHRVALEKLASQGADLREKHLKKALSDLEKMEDTLMETVKKGAAGAMAAGSPMADAWGQVLDKMNAGGTLSGAQAASTVEQMMGQMQTAMRDSRAASLRAARALAESYTAMVSGVLIGMADAMRAPAAAKKTAKK